MAIVLHTTDRNHYANVNPEPGANLPPVARGPGLAEALAWRMHMLGVDLPLGQRAKDSYIPPVLRVQLRQRRDGVLLPYAERFCRCGRPIHLPLVSKDDVLAALSDRSCEACGGPQ